MSNIDLSRRTLVAGAAALSALAAPTGGSQAAIPPDEKLRRLWPMYVARASVHDAARKYCTTARDALDAKLPPRPEGVSLANHSRAHFSPQDWAERSRVYEAWMAAADSTDEIVKAVTATEAQGLFGIGVKLTALPRGRDNPQDLVEAVASALVEIDRLLGTDFAGHSEFAAHLNERKG